LPAEAGKLAGRLGFVQSGIYGKVGRSFLRVFYERQHSATRTGTVHKELANAIWWCLALIERAKPREYIPRMMRRTKIPILYTDAREEPGVPDACGGVLFIPETDEWLAFSAPFPDWVRPLLKPRSKQIFMWEVLGVLVAQATFRERLRNQDFFLYIDNDAANAALSRGYSTAYDACRAAGWFWLECADTASAPYILRVPSKPNPSDSVSRMDLTLAQRHNWQLQDAVFPEKALTALLSSKSLMEVLAMCPCSA
jgi:hypothetical protein